MKAVLSALLSTVYKMEPEKQSELLEKSEEEIAAELLELDKQRVAQFKEKEKKRFNDGHAKGLTETMSKFEKNLREKYSIEDELTGEELVDRIIELKAEESAKAGAGRPAKVTEEDIKKSPLYIQMQQANAAALKKVEDEWKTKFEGREKEIQRQQVLQKVQKSALTTLEEMNPILPEDAKIAAKYKEWFLKELEQYQYEETENGFVVKDSEGNPVEDGHGKLRSFEDLVKDAAHGSFTFNVSQQRSSLGNGKPDATKAGQAPAKTGGNNQQGKPVNRPRTIEELTAIARDTSIPLEQRQQIAKEFNEAQKQLA
jgi:hypothetical protein